MTPWQSRFSRSTDSEMPSLALPARAVGGRDFPYMPWRFLITTWALCLIPHHGHVRSYLVNSLATIELFNGP